MYDQLTEVDERTDILNVVREYIFNNLQTTINGGLGLKFITFSALKYYQEKLNKHERDRFKEGLSLLRKTDYFNNPFLEPDLLRFKDMSDEDIDSFLDTKKNVKINGDWHIINKIDTNYKETPELVTDLVIKVCENREDRDWETFINIKNLLRDNKPQKAFSILTNIRNKLVKKITDYIMVRDGKPSLEPLIDNYTQLMIMTTIEGLKTENVVKRYYTNIEEYNIVYEGGDGNVLDMVFGVDLIIEKNGIYETVQSKKGHSVKSSDVIRYSKKYGNNYLVYVDFSNKLIQKVNLKTKQIELYEDVPQNSLFNDVIERVLRIFKEKLNVSIYTTVDDVFVVKYKESFFRIKIIDRTQPILGEIEKYKKDEYVHFLLYIDTKKITMVKVSDNNQKVYNI